MARQKTSPFEDMVLVASKLPWWAGIALALLSFLVLHVIASRPPLPVAGPGQMGDAVTRGLITILAKFGQYILPFGFSLGALISVINAFRQKKLFNTVASRPGVSALNEMSWSDFERLVSEYYRRNGFQVKRQGGNGPDGGIDLVLRKKSETHLVQCKQWRAYKVGVQPVREFYGVMSSRGVAGGYFVTSGEFTDEAKRFVQGLNLELINGQKLRRMIDIAQQAVPTCVAENPEIYGAVQVPPVAADSSVSPIAPTAPICPKCNAEMKKRVARQGANAGKEFWGCVAFPRCNGTRQLDDSSGDQMPAVPATHPAPVVSAPEKRNCPTCGAEMALRQYQSGPRTGQQFYGCVPCKKGWPVQNV
jgi:restriction system protein